jgi:hypothetical protein
MRYTRIIVTHYGGPDALRVVEEECPEPQDGEVRVRVLAAGVSLPDLMMREGIHPETPPLPLLVEGGERHLGRFLLDTIRAFNVTIRVHGKHGGFHIKNALHQLLLECQQPLPIRLKSMRVHRRISFLCPHHRNVLILPCKRHVAR